MITQLVHVGFCQCFFKVLVGVLLVCLFVVFFLFLSFLYSRCCILSVVVCYCCYCCCYSHIFLDSFVRWVSVSRIDRWSLTLLHIFLNTIYMVHCRWATHCATVAKVANANVTTFGVSIVHSAVVVIVVVVIAVVVVVVATISLKICAVLSVQVSFCLHQDMPI